MPTRQPESTHEAEQDHPIQDPNAPAVEGPSANSMEGASGSVHVANDDDATSGDQDIDTAGTAHDDLSPTKSL